MRIRKSWLAYALVALVLAGVVGVWTVQKNAEASGEESGTALRTVLEVISLMKTQYVDDVDAVALIASYIEQGTINGMLEEAVDDPYTRFMDVRSFEQMQIDTQGEYGGIGIMVGLKDERLTIIAPFEGTPGHQAGLRPGDRIVSIEGKSTEHMSLDEAVGLMRGPAGAGLTLGIQRGEREPFEVAIVRDRIQVPSVTKTELLEPESVPNQSRSVGYIRLQRFSERTDQELEEALNELERKEAEGLILDLRDNPGGALSAAIDVANKFLQDGPILHIVGRDQEKRTVYAFPQLTHRPAPMVVLVNGYSASASEIVAGALQDRGRARLVGTTTFGKGLVQTVIPLRDGSALSLTSARYQTAGGRYIHEKGINPDYVVEVPGIDEVEGESEREVRDGTEVEAEVGNEDATDDAADSQPIESEEDAEVAGEPLYNLPFEEDPQFLKAIEVLEELLDLQDRKAG